MWMQVAQMRMVRRCSSAQWLRLISALQNSEMQMNAMLCNTIRRGGLGILAAASGGTIVETTRYY